MRRNKKRGYQQLRVWEDAVDLYVATCPVFRTFPYELKRVASQQIASSDSIHRNIAEGYCRKSIREYLNHLNIALGSLGETVSGIHACAKAGQLSKDVAEQLDAMAFKLENGMLKLVASLERKRDEGKWEDKMILKESNSIYLAD